MTKHEAVAAYLNGRIDRREFVRRLTMAGVSAGAAIAYAETFSQPAAAAGAGKDARGYISAFQNTSNYPVLDTDGDGYTDAEEEACGSDPHDPNSVCKKSTSSATGLPNTGVGSEAGGGTGWLAPIAAAGAGFALLSRKLRRTTPDD